MKFIFFMLFLICVIIIIFGSWIYYINWRSSIIENIKHKVFYKRIKIKNRVIPNKVIKENLLYLKKELDYRGIKRNKNKFKIDESLKRRVKYSDFRQKEMEELLGVILKYMNLKNDLKLNIYYCSSKKRIPFAGLYDEIKKEISLYIILRDDTFESVLSTLIHECTHHYLISKGIKKVNRNENEILTDLCMVYLGLGKESYAGYKLRNKMLYIDEYYKYQDARKVGYINPGDIKYAMKVNRFL